MKRPSLNWKALNETITKKQWPQLRFYLIQDASQSFVAHALAIQIGLAKAQNTQETLTLCMELQNLNWKALEETITKRPRPQPNVDLIHDVSKSSVSHTLAI